MMRKLLLPTLLVLGLFLSAHTAHAFGIHLDVLNTQVQASRSGAGYIKNNWYSHIGAASAFTGNNLRISDAGSSFRIELITRFGPGDPHTHHTQLGDLFFIRGNSIFAFDLTGWSTSNPTATTNLFGNVTPRNSTAVYGAALSSRGLNLNNFVYGINYRIAAGSPGHTGQPFSSHGAIVAINHNSPGLSLINTATITRPNNNSPYTYLIRGEFNLINALGLSMHDTFDIVWAPTCGNSVLIARAAVIPEPSTLLLLGIGLAGLIWGRRYFFTTS